MIWSYLDNLDQADHPQQGLCFFEHIKDQECGSNCMKIPNKTSESSKNRQTRQKEKPIGPGKTCEWIAAITVKV